MRAASRYVFVVSMNVDADKEALFNEVYDDEHVPNLLQVPGVLAVRRYKTRPFQVAIGGELKQLEAASPHYYAVYEIESPEVLQSDAWAAAVEQGRWPGEVRPYTHERQHVVLEALD